MKPVEIVAYLLTLAICGTGMAAWPEMVNAWIVLAIAILTVAGNRGRDFVLLLALVIVLLTVPMNGIETITFLVYSLLPGVTMGLYVSRSASLGRVLTGGLVLGVLAFSLNWAWQIWQNGLALRIHTIELIFADYFNYTLYALKISGLSDYYAAQGLSTAVLTDIFKSVQRGLEILRPAWYILESWVRILLAVVLSRVVLVRKGILLSPPFTLHRMAWQFDWVIILGLSMWLAGQQWHIDWFEKGGANILLLMTPIVFYFGCSLTVFLYRRFRIRPWIMVILALATLVLPIQTFLFIVVLGVFDPLIDYRNLDGERGSPT